MQNKTVVVVGDKFSEFAALEGVTTVSKLAHLLDDAGDKHELPEQVMLGQGISESWLMYLKKRARARGLPARFVGERLVSERTGRRHSHKWQRRNVLITDPKHVDGQQYQMFLSIDDECEIMSDHVTGLHIQGMVLVEAARQAFLAVTETFHLPGNEKYYFVINNFDIAYHKFAFPVPLEIRFDLTEADRSRPDRLAAKAHIRFYQCGECVCSVEVGYTAILESRLSAREAAMAQAALDHTLAQEADEPEMDKLAA